MSKDKVNFGQVQSDWGTVHGALTFIPAGKECTFDIFGVRITVEANPDGAQIYVTKSEP